jgi:uncharacterized protein (DUF2141 family)
MKEAIENKNITITADYLTASFDNIPHGFYAVTVIHDENGNGLLDKNMMRMPKESFGFSNNPEKVMGPPSYDDAKIPLFKSSSSIEIALKNQMKIIQNSKSD